MPPFVCALIVKPLCFVILDAMMLKPMLAISHSSLGLAHKTQKVPKSELLDVQVLSCIIILIWDQ